MQCARVIKTNHFVWEPNYHKKKHVNFHEHLTGQFFGYSTADTTHRRNVFTHLIFG